MIKQDIILGLILLLLGFFANGMFGVFLALFLMVGAFLFVQLLRIVAAGLTTGTRKLFERYYK